MFRNTVSTNLVTLLRAQTLSKRKIVFPKFSALGFPINFLDLRGLGQENKKFYRKCNETKRDLFCRLLFETGPPSDSHN